MKIVIAFTQIIIISIIVFISSTAFSQVQDKRYAILIGVNNYPNLSSQVNLKYCENDVDKMKETLVGKAFFRPENIQVLKSAPSTPDEKNATRANIESAISSLSNRMDESSMLVFYFSGHGASVPDDQSPEPDKNEEYFLPMDAMPDMTNFIKDDYLIFWLGQIKSGKKVLIIDACYQGEGKSYQLRDKGFTVPRINQQDDLVAASDVFMTASSGNEAAYEDDDAQNSKFTRYFAEALDNINQTDTDENRLINFTEIHSYITGRITDQTPQLILKGEDIVFADHTTGYVTVTGTPIGADVYLGNELIGQTPITNFKYNVGSYFLRIEKESYQNHINTGFSVNPGWDNNSTYTLSPLVGTISGRVVDSRGIGVGGAKVSLRGTMINVSGNTETITTGDGSFILNVSIGEYTGMVIEKFPAYKPKTMTNPIVVEINQLRQIGEVLLEREVAGLAVSTNISGVAVYVNDDYKGVTPIGVIPDLPTGDYKVRFIGSNIVEKTADVHVTAGQINQLIVTDLEYKYGTLSIDSEPAGASVKIGNDVIGTTPINNERLIVGTYTLEIGGLPGYGGTSVPVDISWNENARPTRVVLKKDVAQITINTNVESASITIQERMNRKVVYSGEVKGTANTPELKFGNYTVIGRVGSLGELTKSVIISEAKSTVVNFEFLGGIEINGSPTGAKVYIDGNEAGKLPYRFDNQKVGTYTVDVKAAGYDNQQQAVNVETNKTKSVQFILPPKSRTKAMTRSLTLIGRGQWYSGRKTRAVTLGMAEAGAIAGAIYFNLQFGTKEDEYNTAVNDYRSALTNIEAKWAIAEQKFDDMNNLRDYTNYAIYAAAGLWVYNILDAYIFMPRLDSIPTIGGNTELSVLPVNGGFKASLSFRF